MDVQQLPQIPTSPNLEPTYPTEPRIKQKERLKRDKEAGIKPRKIKKTIEAGDDDCGDDLKGLETVTSTTYIDSTDDDLDNDSDDAFVSIPSTLPATESNVFSIIPTLCYGRRKCVDMLELCGGEGHISELAFRRGYTSGGNLDLRCNVDLGNETVQKAILHYLKTCIVICTVLQPSCRSTGPPSYFNAK
eukprot:2058797-Pyramimonas_sp.AAC.1